MSSYTWRIGKTFLLWGSSHESLKSGLILRSSCHTSSIWKASLVWVLSSHAPSRNLILKKTLSPFVLCNKMASLLSGSYNGFSSYLILRSSCQNVCTWMASLPCGSSHVSLSCLLVKISSYTLITFWNSVSSVWALSWVSGGLILRSSCHTLSIWKASLLCVFYHLMLCQVTFSLEKTLSHFVQLRLCTLASLLSLSSQEVVK